MEKRISILGSTGSIGRQTVEVIEKLGIKAAALTANRSVDMLEQQARRLKPEVVAAYDKNAAADLRIKLRDTNVRVLSGMDGMIEAASLESVDTVVTAVVGTIGLKPTMAAISERKRIALANKETLVCAGRIVMAAAEKCGAEILPVDSEHSAIFQCLMGRGKNEIKKILLTASGGPFRGKTWADMEKVTKADALKHPNWNMGQKITVDSATMMNKGLELIEAMHLFKVRPDQVKPIVHPQSIIHSMVEFEDNSVVAQLGLPDMRLPIQLALTYPKRVPSLSGEIDFGNLSALTFEEPDLEAFKCLGLAMETAAKPGAACAVMNGANEAAVGLFLQEKIGFCDIYRYVREAVEQFSDCPAEDIDTILYYDEEARKFINRKAQ